MKIRNWKKFQHFKDRKPPWVKLYRDVLDDLEWYELDPLASKVLVMCWLIASEDDGKLPSTKTLAFRLRMTEKQTNDCLNKLSHWMEQDDINAISEQYQDDSLETETETETETKKEIKAEKKSTKGSRLSADFVLAQDWIGFCQQYRPDLNPQKVFDGFKDYWVSKTGSGATKLDWTATWRNWVRNQRQEKPNFADIARTTVPSKKERDPVLVKLEQDRQNAVPIPEDIKANFAKLRGRS